MTQLAIVICILGFIAALIGDLWIIVCAFNKNILWGLGVLFIQPIIIAFVILYFNDVKKPLFIWVLGLFLFLCGMLIATGSTPSRQNGWENQPAYEFKDYE
ncbi:MAG: hypothetical protein JW928_05490 [Candidatus Aureabacteria bacterium]|nr:hypothetical protein [Candidatus Auribacterota bacterium]